MKHKNLQRFSEAQSVAIAPLNQTSLSHRCAILILTGVLSLGSGFVESAGAIALKLTDQAPAPASITFPVKVEDNLATKPTGSIQLSPPLANKLRQDLSQRTGISPGKLRVIEASRKNWSDGCLELAKPGEICTFGFVEGWHVVLSDGNRRWIYRTDLRGLNRRLESPARSTPRPASEGSIQPSRISPNELPPALNAKTIFRAIASGGFIGRTYETTLTSDGRIIRILINSTGTTVKPEIRHIPQQQVWQFQQLLQQHHLERFHRFNYPATPGSADFTTITLSSRSSTVRYANTVQGQLPASLQAIIQGWNQIARSN